MTNPNRDRWNDPRAKRFREAVAGWHTESSPNKLLGLFEAGRPLAVFAEHHDTLRAIVTRMEQQVVQQFVDGQEPWRQA